MKTWLTSDWHLGENRLGIMQRPFESDMDMVEGLIERHNAVVKPKDRVIIVGDVVYQKRPEFIEFVSKFNGIKTLVRGNHDRVFSDSDLEPYFEEIIPDGEGMFIKIHNISCYITHYPTRSIVSSFNLVGHIHSSWKVQLNMLNVGVDVHHFKPVPLTKVPFYLKAIRTFYDDDVWVCDHEANAFYKGKRGKEGSYFKEESKP